MKIEDLHNIFLESDGVTTDTRTIAKNTIFFALKGDNFNGNSFSKQALEKGAKVAVIDEKEHYINDKTILVNNCLETLQKLANYHRKTSKAKVISLTGSNGKTTTKELIFHTLKQEFNTIATSGNLNNHIGVPLSLLKITKDTEYAIIEMGANHQKEIELLCTIAEPDYGYITNFGKAHLEGFGGFEGVIKGKSELYYYLKENNKTIFFNCDDSIQNEKINGYKNSFSFTLENNPKADTALTSSIKNEFVHIETQNTSIQTNLIGQYNSTNIAIAITMGLFFKTPIEKIKKGIENYIPNNNRSQIINSESNKIILDAYNANPSSMQASLNNFNKSTGKQKYVIIGDMLELGSAATEEHQNIINIANSMNFEKIITLGKLFYNTKGQSEKFSTFEELKKYITENPIKDSFILIKGSRRMKMERLLELV